MPWTAHHALRHTRKATTPKKRKAWRDVANKVRANKKYGRTVKEREGAAVRIANFVVNRMSGGSGRGPVKKPAVRRRTKLRTHDPLGRKLAPLYYSKYSRKRRNGPGRKAGFKHSAATRRKISLALKRHHRTRTRKAHRARRK